MTVFYDDAGAIGAVLPARGGDALRLTIDFETLGGPELKDIVTLRDRDNGDPRED
jgi:hypothetical protein